MKWIYAELRNIYDVPLETYKINPAYIMAVNLNKQQIIIRDFQHPLNYREEDEEKILKLMDGDVND